MKKNCAKSCGKCSESGCKDESSKCSGYASKNYCTRAAGAAWMNKNCAKSCGKCSESEKPVTASKPAEKPKKKPVAASKPAEKPKGCKDYKGASMCSRYARKNYCTKHARWMNKNCAKRCGKCSESEKPVTSSKPAEKSEGCKDYKGASKCSWYASKNYCTATATTTKWMNKNCAKSCGKCSKSGKEQCQYKDRLDKCARYKSLCTHKQANKRAYVNKWCPKTCKC